MITQSQLNTCRRVADYLRKTALPFLADIYADRDAETEKKRAVQSSFYLEFYLVFYPSEVERVNNKLEFGIRQFAENKIDGNKLKAICDEFIKCHTVAWQDGMPYWKSKEVNK
jgi:hypothetical protein